MMLNARELIRKAFEFQEYEAVPIDARDVTDVPGIFPPYYVSGTPFVKGTWTDYWGCVWESLEDNVCGEVKYHPLADWNALDNFKAPWDMLTNADFTKVNAYCESTGLFVCPMWEPVMPCPFERAQFLRGTENLFLDLAYGDARIIKLLGFVHEYYLKQVEEWAKTDIDSIQIHDDWGSQNALLVSPSMWREYFKPLYKQYCDIAHSHGKYVLMHSDGYIREIIPDLIEIGVNAVNSQLFCMNIEELARSFHHKLVFWGEIDRQYIQVYGSPDEMRSAVRRIAEAFYKYGKTGVVATCSYTMNVRQENKDAEWDEWGKVLDREYK